MPDFAPVAEFLRPRSVAVIGASEDLTKFGGRLFRLLVQHGYEGAIYPINPKRDMLLGMKAYPSIDATPTAPDIAVMAVPRDHVRDAVRACAAAGTKAAVIITAKFSDAGAEGAALEAEIVREARAGGMRLIGPNCLGIISPASRLTLCASPALFVDSLPLGDIGMVSQSGALMATIFDRAQTRGIGFSHCFSIGNQADLDLADFVDFLVDDPDTRVICCYIEGLKDAGRFLRAVERARADGKPVIAVKAGRTEHGAAAAFSHTASLAGSYDVFAAACRGSGVVLLDDPDAMITLAASLARYVPPRRLDAAILTTSGGGGAITADRLADAAIPLAALTDTTRQGLSPDFDGPAAAANPIDMGAARSGGSVAVVENAMRLLMEDECVGLVLAPITTAPDVRLICESLVNGAEAAASGPYAKPWIIVLQPGQAGDAARRMLRERKALYCDSLDEAIRAFAGYRSLRAMQRFPVCARPTDLPDASALAGIEAGALGEDAAKAVLAAYGVAVNRGAPASTPERARQVADGLAAPFVVKILSPDIVHKSDAGGVVLDLPDADAVEEASRAMLGRLARTHPNARLDGVVVQEMRRAPLVMLIGARRAPPFGTVVTGGGGGVV
ncbi:MAG: acetate--CoA ligase family protein, partial [Rhodobacteraceae bacterium]|nr:acetate--CoA ligase family protein [Paracoccaceae bacterium]